MSPKRRRHRATDKRVERTEERTSVGEGTAAQRYAAFQEHARAGLVPARTLGGGTELYS